MFDNFPLRPILIGSIILLACKVVLWPPLTLQLRSEEPRRAAIAMEMNFADRCLQPTLHGHPYYNKPPLFSWILVKSMQWGNKSEYFVRLPGILSHLFTTIFLFLWVRKILNVEAGLFSALIYLTAGEILFYGIMLAGEIDLFFTMLVFLQFALLYLGLTEEKHRLKYLTSSYVFAGLGFLTKGLPSVVFLVLTVLVWLLIERKRKHHIWQHLPGILLSAFLVGSYFLALHLHGGDAKLYLINLFNEASQKSGFESTGSRLFKNVLEFPTTFLKIVLPWSIIALSLLFIKQNRIVIWKNRLTRFCVIFILSNIGLFWFADVVTARYLYPFAPFLAVITAQLIIIHSTRVSSIKILDVIGTLLVLLAPIAVILFMWKGSVEVRHPIVKAAAALFLSALAFFLYRREKVLTVVLIILCVKWYSHWTFYPLRYEHDKNLPLRSVVPILFEHSGDQDIHLLGLFDTSTVHVALGPVNFASDTLAAPMPLSYQLPYYIERHQKGIMRFDTIPRDQTYYLTRSSLIPKYSETTEITPLFEFVDDWKSIPLTLIKTGDYERR